MNAKTKLTITTLSMAIALAPWQVRADDPIKLAWVGKGGMPLMGGYMPQRLTLSTEKPPGLKKEPEIKAPSYAVLKFGQRKSAGGFILLLDEPEGSPSKLYVDANGNGDLTDDPPAEWTHRPYKTKDGQEMDQATGGVTITVSYADGPAELHFGIYRFDKRDPDRESLKNVLFYYGDYARKGEITLGGKSYAALLCDDFAGGDFTAEKGVRLVVDVDGDKKFARGTHESFAIGKPFNIGGVTYEVQGMSPSGGSFVIVKSDKTVAEIKAPPPPKTFKAGDVAPKFQGKLLDGNGVNFPADYKGKLVILDFWATWCGPCVAELPNLKAAYAEYHNQGVEVLGISLDRADMAEKVKAFTTKNEMPWNQVYDGGFWQAAVAKLYDIHSIPTVLLVDGDTGKMIAVTSTMRGEALKPTLKKALADRIK